MLFRRICGVDLGTDTIKISDKYERQYVCEKNMLAIRNRVHVIAIGARAYEIYEKAPLSVEVTRPMIDGAIADVKNQEIVLKRRIKQFTNIISKNPDIIMAAPGGISELEKMAYHKLLTGNIRAKRVALIENGLADAIGIGMPVLHSMGNMIVNIGASTTDISVVADKKIIIGRRLNAGGDQMDHEIVNLVRRNYNLNIGTKTAEQLKNNLAYVGPKILKKAKVFGIHTVTGLPVSAEILSEDVHECILDMIRSIANNVRITLERTPPQLVADIQKNGIYITGGVSQIPGMADYIGEFLDMHTYNVPDPVYSTLRGLVQVINSPELRKLTFSVRDFTGVTL